jgi:hypothetical protein
VQLIWVVRSTQSISRAVQPVRSSSGFCPDHLTRTQSDAAVRADLGEGVLVLLCFGLILSGVGLVSAPSLSMRRPDATDLA